jgi:hypothetical protein
MAHTALVIALAFSVSLEAQHARKQAALVIVPSHDLPETAQMPTDSMFLQSAGNGQTYLYLEQKAKNRIVVLNVTRPSKIRQESLVALEVAAPFDFVRSIGPDVSLICFRGERGSGVMSFHKPLQPTVTMLPALRQAMNIEQEGSSGLIVISGKGVSPRSPEQTVQVVDLTDPDAPLILATIPNTSQQVEDHASGARYILSDAGLTVVRQPEIELQSEINSKFIN